MKRTLGIIFALTLALILSACAAQAALDTAEPAAVQVQSDPNRAYALEKLNEVNDMILERKVVPEDYFRYLGEELAQAVEEYNTATAVLRSSYLGKMEGYAKIMAYSYGGAEVPDDSVPASSIYLLEERPDHFYEFIDRAATLALYRNVGDLMQSDPVTAYPASAESGGSYGLWATDLLHDASVGAGLSQQTEEYLDQVDALLEKLDETRKGWTQGG